MDNSINENILPDILLLQKNIPKDLSPLEQVRWIYINLGKLFSYDFRVAKEPEYGYNKTIDFEKGIDRYQTCIQISYILNTILNQLPNVQSKIIERSSREIRGNYGQDHVGNDVIINDNGFEYHIILDLTLDLYLIQSDCKTLHFGYQDDGTGTYDIISQTEDEHMDIKLGFINSYKDYTDYKIKEVKEYLGRFDKDKVDSFYYLETVLSCISKLYKKFAGYHEGVLYTNILFRDLLDGDYKDFNLFYESNDLTSMKTVYHINYKGCEKWLIYSNKVGFMNTDIESIKELLNSGWYTRSETLQNMIFNKTK